jgi:ABC-type amino acid transport substrate-binding protein
MNRTATRLALAALALAASFPARADMAEVKLRGTLRVLVPADENPAWFSLQPTGEPGFEREVLEGFARLQGLKLEAQPVQPWSEAIPGLLKARGDLIAGMNVTDARRRQVDFTVELMPSQHIVVTLEPHRVVKTLDQLGAEEVGVSPGTTWAEAVAKAGIPAARTELCSDVKACLDDLRAGRITATVMDLADLLLEGRAEPRLQGGLVLGPLLSSAWGVRKTDVVLRRELDAYLTRLKGSPKWSVLVVKYFGDDALRILGRTKDHQHERSGAEP